MQVIGCFLYLISTFKVNTCTAFNEKGCYIINAIQSQPFANKTITQETFCNVNGSKVRQYSLWKLNVKIWTEFIPMIIILTKESWRSVQRQALDSTLKADKSTFTNFYANFPIQTISFLDFQIFFCFNQLKRKTTDSLESYFSLSSSAIDKR